VRMPPLAMSTITAAGLICRYLEKQPTVPLDEAIEAIQRSVESTSALDYEGARKLLNACPGATIDHHNPLHLRELISNFIEINKPSWIDVAPFGRDLVESSLTVNEAQVLRTAGLFDNPPSDDVVEWWDNLATRARAFKEQRLLERGRAAERLTLEYEHRRLARLGVELSPVWIAIQDNTTGYDILSYDLVDDATVARHIEVKSSLQMPATFFLTSNEWDRALSLGNSFRLYLWSLPRNHLRILTLSDLLPHVPINQGRGKWQSMAVAIPMDQGWETVDT